MQYVQLPALVRSIAAWVLLCLYLLLPKSSLAGEIPGYHSYDALTRALREAVNAHPNLARLTSVGTTIEGREIWVVELGSDGGTPLSERPALFIGANFEGNQLVGSELSLLVIRYLLENYDSDEAVRQRLDNYTFYFFPRVNPDGAERMFMRVQTGQSTNAGPHDDDNDGRIDEDGPDDLDGDGLITLMRVFDPDGDYMVDSEDERAMKAADPRKGETGSYKIYWEGLDDDYDGFYNEDAAGGVNINRNFQHAYPYYEREAGIHMVSERESRAVMDFVIAHRNIALMFVFGENDNLISPPNKQGKLAEAKNIKLFQFADASNDDAGEVGMVSTQPSFFSRRFFRGDQQDETAGSRGQGRRPATTVNKDDLDYFTTISEHYTELTGIEKAPGVDKPAGAFFEYGYFQFGVPSFSTPGWGIPSVEADSSEGGSGKPGGGARRGGKANGDTASSLDRDMLKWMDDDSLDGFVEWAAFNHPTLGEVEIGGFKPYEVANPPYAMVEELGPKQGAFVVYLASLFAEVRIAETEVINHGGGIFRIKAEVENAGFLPTSSAHGVVSRSVKPTMVQLGIEPDDLLSGDAKTSFFQATDGSGKRRSFEWLVRGNRGDRIELKVVSQKGGGDTAQLTLE